MEIYEVIALNSHMVLLSGYHSYVLFPFFLIFLFLDDSMLNFPLFRLLVSNLQREV